MPVPWTNGNVDPTKPAGTRSPKLGDDDIREWKRQVMERLEDIINGFKTTDTDSSLPPFKMLNIPALTADPTSPITGQIWLRSDL
jgi:hypothetical protein